MKPDDSAIKSEIFPGLDQMKRYGLLEALLKRRSRRYSRGIEIEGGPTQYTSKHDPHPLSEREQAILAFAACGITGPALGDWSYEPDAGSSFAQFVGRTAASPDAAHPMAMFVMDDEATWLARRPQDMEPEEVAEVVELTQAEEFVEAWRLMRVKVADERRHPPIGPPYNPTVNDWALHAEGTTYFLPVSELTHVLLNVLPGLVNKEHGFFFVDERRSFQPAGVGRFARSRGGHLDDDPSNGRVFPWGHFERLNAEFCAVEQGMALQNLGLACQAMGLSGFPHYAFHDEGWFEALGFRMGEMPTTEFMNVGLIPSAIMRLTGQNVSMSYPLGLERDGEVLLKSYCPPYFDSMEDAVRAIIDEKFGEEGVYGNGGSGIYEERTAERGWKDPERITAGAAAPDEQGVEAAIALSEYLWEQYGRFPATYPPFHTLMGFQAGHVDEGFYDEYYQVGALSETHRSHDQRWHQNGGGTDERK